MTECLFWTPELQRKANEASSFLELGEVALSVLRSMPQPVCQLCGPLTTGGFGCMDKNAAVFRRAVKKLRDRGLNPFDQMPIQLRLDHLVSEWKKKNGDRYCLPILDEIYLKIFESGLVRTMFFLPGWQSSVGTSWERRIGQELKISIRDFPREWYWPIVNEVSAAA